MPRLIWAFLLLAACASAPAPQAAFRDAGAPIWSAAAFAPSRLEGSWAQAAAFAMGDAPGCPPGKAEFTRSGDTMTLSAKLCLNGREVAIAGPVRVAGPGRIAVPGMDEWWVIWVDSGYRTLAIATPSGAFGFVLDRGQIGQDRLAAAREIFAFNGYETSGFQPF